MRVSSEPEGAQLHSGSLRMQIYKLSQEIRYNETEIADYLFSLLSYRLRSSDELEDNPCWETEAANPREPNCILVPYADLQIITGTPRQRN